MGENQKEDFLNKNEQFCGRSEVKQVMGALSGTCAEVFDFYILRTSYVVRIYIYIKMLW